MTLRLQLPYKKPLRLPVHLQQDFRWWLVGRFTLRAESALGLLLILWRWGAVQATIVVPGDALPAQYKRVLHAVRQYQKAVQASADRQRLGAQCADADRS